MRRLAKNEEAISTPGTRGPSTRTTRPGLGSYKVQQRQIIHRGRTFHFVSYEDQRAPWAPDAGWSANWYLMSAGTRWEVMPQVAGEAPEDTDRRLLEWLTRTLA